MTVWLAIAALAGAALVLVLWRTPDRAGAKLVAAALTLGLAAYAAQGRPELPAAPSPATAGTDRPVRERLLRLRSDMDQHFGPSRTYLVLADAATAGGDYPLAEAWIHAGLMNRADDADLWDALGVDLLMASRFRMSPAVTMAFARAHAFNPAHPGPAYFTGLAALADGDPVRAERLWSAALATGGGKGSDWRVSVTGQLGALRATMAPGAGQLPRQLAAPAGP